MNWADVEIAFAPEPRGKDFGSFRWLPENSRRSRNGVGSNLLQSNLPYLHRLTFGIARELGGQCNEIQDTFAEFNVNSFLAQNLYPGTSIFARRLLALGGRAGPPE